MVDIASEDDLLYLVYRRMQEKGREVYPKVNSISKWRLTPDIDLLEIDRYKSPHLTIGYEFKLLKYSKEIEQVSFRPFYSALGQVLCYLQHGLNKAYLVFGCSQIPREIIDETENEVEKGLKEICGFIKKIFDLGPIGFQFFRHGLFLPKTLFEAESNFSVQSYKDPELKWRLLLREQFGWGESWLMKMGKRAKLEPPPPLTLKSGAENEWYDPDSDSWKPAVEITNPFPEWAEKIHIDAPWMWKTDMPLPKEEVTTNYTVTFRRNFELPKGFAIKASIEISADNEFELLVNGKPIGSDAKWKDAHSYDISSYLHPGKNEIGIIATNFGMPEAADHPEINPAGVIYQAKISYDP